MTDSPPPPPPQKKKKLCPRVLHNSTLIVHYPGCDLRYGDPTGGENAEGSEPASKEGPDYKLSGKLTEYSNTYKVHYLISIFHK